MNTGSAMPGWLDQVRGAHSGPTFASAPSPATTMAQAAPRLSAEMNPNYGHLPRIDYELDAPRSANMALDPGRDPEPVQIHRVRRQDGIDVPIVVSRHRENEQVGGHANHFTLAGALARLPAPIARTIGAVVVSPYKDRRSWNTMGSALHGTIYVRPLSAMPDPDENRLVNLLLHEGTHTWQEKNGWRFGAPSVWTGAGAARVAWEQAMRADGAPAPTRYAEESSHEDMAEFIALYAAAHGTPGQASMKARYPNRSAIARDLLA